jgi:hypothetical protein
MYRIKVSTPWDHIDFNTRIGSVLKDSPYTFDFSDTCHDCDFWVVWGGIKGNAEQAYCPPPNVIYLTDEVHDQRFFNKRFLNQFAAIITCRTDLVHKRVIPCHELNTWMIEKDYDSLEQLPVLQKSKQLSVVCSDQTWLPGHKLRYAFVNKLAGHFKDKIDVFGRGFNPVADKFSALADYKYSIAIENAVIPGYFTEKLTDCYLARTMPLYYGCPDIHQYFDPRSYLPIDPNDFHSSVKSIECLLEQDPYDQLLPLLEEQRQLYLAEYHIFNKLVKLLDTHLRPAVAKQSITIHRENTLQRGYGLNNLITAIYARLHIPAKYYFQISLSQAGTYANIATPIPH